MKERNELVLKFMLALASNPKIHNPDAVKMEEHYIDIWYDATKLTDAYLNCAR
jgi:hypothetical protein